MWTCLSNVNLPILYAINREEGASCVRPKFLSCSCWVLTLSLYSRVFDHWAKPILGHGIDQMQQFTTVVGPARPRPRSPNEDLWWRVAWPGPSSLPTLPLGDTDVIGYHLQTYKEINTHTHKKWRGWRWVRCGGRELVLKAPMGEHIAAWCHRWGYKSDDETVRDHNQLGWLISLQILDKNYWKNYLNSCGALCT